MRKLRKKVTIDASAQADIAFLLLIFYLVATTISNDFGILRKLPSEIQNPDETEVRKRNVIEILVNKNGELLFENQLMNSNQFSGALKDYIVNANGLSHLPEKERLNDPDFGVYSRTKHVISLQNHRSTLYTDYIRVQDEILATYRSLRNDVALEKFGMTYDVLKARSKTDASYLAKVNFIKKMVPQRISEATPYASR